MFSLREFVRLHVIARNNLAFRASGGPECAKEKLHGRQYNAIFFAWHATTLVNLATHIAAAER